MIVYQDGESKEFDVKPGSLLRALVESWFCDWEEYEILYLKRNLDQKHSVFKYYKVHNEDGPAAVRKDGSMEWWLDGQKLCVTTQKEFECYMRNKAFW